MSMQNRAPLSEDLEDALTPSELAAVWGRVGAARARRPRRLAITLGAAGLAAALLLGVHIVGRTEPRALTLADDQPITSVPKGTAVLLADGSRVTASRDAALHVIENRGDRIEWRLARGRARFDVRPHGPRRWHVVSAGVSVEVSGTSFVVDRTLERVRVSVLEGVVLVRHPSLPDGVRRLEVGELVEVALERRTRTDTRTSAAAASADAVPDEPSPDADSATLLRRADGARRARRFGAAIDALETIIADHPRSHEASLAAFTLGRLEEDLGRPGRAARAYRRALTLGLREPLREEAHARWSEAATRAGDQEGAREAARRYEAAYPGGTHLERLRALGAE